MISSQAWDRVYLLLGALFSVAGLSCLVSIFAGTNNLNGFIMAPGIALPVFALLAVVSLGASRPKLLFTEQGITGLAWGRREVRFEELSSWQIKGSLLLIWFVDRKQMPRMRHWLSLRPGAPLDCVSLALEPEKVRDIIALLEVKVGQSN
jgi:hypothetical protein